MQFDLSAVENATLVFIGTLVFGLADRGFRDGGGLPGHWCCVGVGGSPGWSSPARCWDWSTASTTCWDRLVHHASTVELPGDFQGQPSPSTGTYPRVALRDS